MTATDVILLSNNNNSTFNPPPKKEWREIVNVCFLHESNK